MNRRGFIGSILALGSAPAIVRAESLMRVLPLDTASLTRPMLNADEMRRVIESRMRELKADMEHALTRNRMESVDFYPSDWGMRRAP